MLRKNALLIFSMIGLSYAAQEPSELTIDQALKHLSSDDFTEREDATLFLWQNVDQALPQLKAEVDGDSPEKTYRIRGILNKVAMGLSADSSQEVLDFIDQFRKSDQLGRVLILKSLVGPPHYAYRPALHLYASDRQLRKDNSLYRLMDDASISAARQAIDDAEIVRKVLSLSPNTKKAKLALAVYLRELGLLDEELNRIKGEGADLAYRLTLLKEKGDDVAAREVAQKIWDVRELAILDLLQGDPVPYMEWRMSVGNGRRRVGGADVVHRRKALEIWKSGANSVPEYEDFRPEDEKNEPAPEKEIEGANLDVDLLDLRTGILLGLKKQALSEMDESALFLYYRLQENWRKAFEVIDFEDTPVEREKLQGEFDEMVKQGEHRSASEDFARAMDIVWFYYEHGAFDEVNEIVGPTLDRLLKKDATAWGNLLIFMGASSSNYNYMPICIHYMEKGMKQMKRIPANLVDFVTQGGGDELELFSKGLFARMQEELEDDVFRKFLVIKGYLSGEKGELDEILKSVLPLLKNDEEKQMLAALRALRYDLSTMNDLLKGVKKVTSPVLRRRLAEYALLREDGKEAKKWVDTSSRSAVAFYEQSLAALYAGDKSEADEYFRRGKAMSLGEWWSDASRAELAENYGRKEDWLEAGRDLLLRQYQPVAFESKRLGTFAEAARVNRQWKLAAALYQVGIFEGYGSDEAGFSRGLTSFRDFKKPGYLFLCRGMDALDRGEKETALKYLNHSFQLLWGSGILADDFMPIVRGRVPDEVYRKWFDQANAYHLDTLERFPNADNTLNSSAWLASRSVLDLDRAEANVKKALSIEPLNHAYLDTLGEVKFAQGKRKEALKWSRQSLKQVSGDPALWGQYRHFRDDPMPR